MTPRRATFLIFFIVGIGIAAWAPLVPVAKARLALDDASLGLVLLALGGGSMIGLPLSGLLTQRFGAARVCLVAGLILSLALPVLAAAPHVAVLVVGLAVFGAALGTADVAMNAGAVVVERDAGRALMSGFHGGFSLGGLLGAGAASALLELGTTPLATASLMGAICAAITLAAALHVPPAQQAGASLALPRGRLLLIGGLCFIGFLVEGTILDWSAVLLRFHRGASLGSAGLAFAGFSLTMTLCRLTGDAVVRRFGARTVLAAGGALAASGALLTSAADSLTGSIIGCALVGIGCANVVPVLFAQAGRTQGMAPGLAIAAAATPGYAGLLVGPALVGLLAEAISLPTALAAAGALMLVVTFTAGVVTRR